MCACLTPMKDSISCTWWRLHIVSPVGDRIANDNIGTHFTAPRAASLNGRRSREIHLREERQIGLSLTALLKNLNGAFV